MMITETLQELSLWELEGDIEDVIDMLIEVQEIYLKTHTNISLERDWHGDEEVLKLKGTREETKREIESRLFKEKSSAERDRASKLAELNKLKQELGLD
jgi:hypothetical protein